MHVGGGGPRIFSQKGREPIFAANQERAPPLGWIGRKSAGPFQTLAPTRRGARIYPAGSGCGSQRLALVQRIDEPLAQFDLVGLHAAMSRRRSVRAAVVRAGKLGDSSGSVAGQFMWAFESRLVGQDRRITAVAASSLRSSATSDEARNSTPSFRLFACLAALLSQARRFG